MTVHPRIGKIYEYIRPPLKKDREARDDDEEVRHCDHIKNLSRAAKLQLMDIEPDAPDDASNVSSQLDHDMERVIDTYEKYSAMSLRAIMVSASRGKVQRCGLGRNHAIQG